MNKINVLLVDQLGGKTFEYDFAAAKNYSSDFCVTCYVSDDTPKNQKNDGFNVELGFHNVFSGSKIQKGFKYIFALNKLRKFIRKNKFNIINLQWYNLPFVDKLFIKKIKKYGCKVVLTVHGVIPRERNHKLHDSLNKIYKYGDAIFLHSNEALTLFNKEFSVKCKKYVITSAFRDESDYQKVDKIVARKKLGLPLDKKIILSFGTIREDKRIDDLYKAFLMANDESDNLFLVSAGTLNAKDKNYYLKLAKKCTDTGNAKVIFDYISKEDEPLFYSSADLLVLPYDYISQSGVAYCGLLFGCPMLGSNIPRLDIMIKNGINGEFFEKGNVTDLKNKMIKLLKNDDLIEKYSNGSTFVLKNDFSIKNRVKISECAYKEILKI